MNIQSVPPRKMSHNKQTFQPLNSEDPNESTRTPQLETVLECPTLSLPVRNPCYHLTYLWFLLTVVMWAFALNSSINSPFGRLDTEGEFVPLIVLLTLAGVIVVSWIFRRLCCDTEDGCLCFEGPRWNEDGIGPHSCRIDRSSDFYCSTKLVKIAFASFFLSTLFSFCWFFVYATNSIFHCNYGDSGCEYSKAAPIQVATGMIGPMVWALTIGVWLFLSKVLKEERVDRSETHNSEAGAPDFEAEDYKVVWRIPTEIPEGHGCNFAFVAWLVLTSLLIGIGFFWTGLHFSYGYIRISETWLVPFGIGLAFAGLVIFLYAVFGTCCVVTWESDRPNMCTDFGGPYFCSRFLVKVMLGLLVLPIVAALSILAMWTNYPERGGCYAAKDEATCLQSSGIACTCRWGNYSGSFEPWCQASCNFTDLFVGVTPIPFVLYGAIMLLWFLLSRVFLSQRVVEVVETQNTSIPLESE